ncbi:ATP-binding cassette domain-containing protein [Salinibius halmophilus]|uniref:ATP-binding cassette domain-containing protein n=1 Tax=Salinibius halmophilus TaxID=1853216 RepID=UPI000E66C059|nr:ATP-binding cassette domain-containing protein [Salinibius halmophilus]
MHSLELQNVTTRIGEQALFSAVSLTVAASEVVAVMGPSGVGKSTLLNHILGMLPADITGEGSVLLDGVDIGKLNTEHRGIGLVAQDDWLFPHMTVWQNLKFAQPKSMNRQDGQAQITQYLSEAGLLGLEKHLPSQLSGGQRQRVAVLRMLMAQPKAVLLDEPFSKLDQQLRRDFRHWCFSVLAERSLPALLVSHDPQDVAGLRCWQLDKGDWHHA